MTNYKLSSRKPSKNPVYITVWKRTYKDRLHRIWEGITGNF